MLVQAAPFLLLLPLFTAGTVSAHGLAKRRCDAPARTVTSTVYVNAASTKTSAGASAGIPASSSRSSSSPAGSSSKVTTTPASSSSVATSSSTSIKPISPSSATTPSSKPAANPTSSSSSTPVAAAPTSANPSGTFRTSYTGKTSGTATFYGNDGSGGTCKLPARSDLAFVAWPGAAWQASKFCGMCLKITGDKGSTFAQVTNKCPECPEGNLDLSTATFNKIVSTSGVGPISWTPVDCVSAGLEPGTLSYFWKSGSSAYWAGIQVRGAAAPIESVEVAPSGSSSFQKLERQDYNYFLAPSGLGAGPFAVRTTFQDGTSKTEQGVKLNENVENA